MRTYTQGPAAGTTIVLLATGASVNLVLEPIYSTSVWGAGWYNAATTAHYADSGIRFEGSIDIELQGNTNFWNLIRDWGIEQRAYPRSFDISPDGARIYQYRTTGTYGSGTTGIYDRNGVWCTSLGFSTSEGSFVTVSAGAVALFRTEVPAAGSGFCDGQYIKQRTGVIADDCTVLADTFPLNPGGTNVNPIPFWRTNANLLYGTYSSPFSGGSVPDSGLETVEWSVDLANNSIWLYTMNGDRLPTALLQGPIDATGSVTLYHPCGVFDPVLGPAGTGSITSPFLYAENTWFRVEIARGASASVYLEMPAVVIESDDYGIPGQDSVTNRTFGLKGLGGRCDGTTTLPPLLMSLAT